MFLENDIKEIDIFFGKINKRVANVSGCKAKGMLSQTLREGEGIICIEITTKF